MGGMPPPGTQRNLLCVTGWGALVSMLAVVAAALLIALEFSAASVLGGHRTSRRWLLGTSPSPDGVHASLPVILVCFNPAGFASRWASVRAQQARLAATEGVTAYTVELAYGEDAFHVTSSADAHHLQLRLPADAVMWHKEALMNAGVAQLLPPNWRAVAFVDAEVVFESHCWAVDTLRQLLSGTVDAVQPFASASQFGDTYAAFAAVLAGGGHFERKRLGDTRDVGWPFGIAWAMTRNMWDSLGGLYPYAIAGTGDVLLAAAIFRNASLLRGIFKPDGYAAVGAARWYAAAPQPPLLRVGFVGGHMRHDDHGTERNRKYFHDNLYLKAWTLLCTCASMPTACLCPPLPCRAPCCAHCATTLLGARRTVYRL